MGDPVARVKAACLQESHPVGEDCKELFILASRGKVYPIEFLATMFQGCSQQTGAIRFFLLIRFYYSSCDRQSS